MWTALLIAVLCFASCLPGGRASEGSGGGGQGVTAVPPRPGVGEGSEGRSPGEGGAEASPEEGEGEGQSEGAPDEGTGEPEGGEGADGVDPGDGGDRSADEVCAHWTAEHAQVFPEWEDTGEEGRCALGRVPDDAIANGVRRTNLYRWLVGLDPVVLAPERSGMQQECAVIMSALGGLSHTPRADAPCYTVAGASAAGSSNLSYGSGLAGSVDAYVSDRGVPSLGHRRWILNPSMTATAFGYRPPAGCMHVFSFGANARVDFIAWPPAGPVPFRAAQGAWSISFFDLRPDGEIRIEVDVDGAGLRDVAAQRLGGGVAGDPTYAFQPPPGSETRVVVHGADLEYTVRFVDCRN